MRDILVLFALVIPMIYGLKYPWVAMMVWVVVSLLNPHRYTYGFAFTMPFALMAAIAVFAGLIFSKDPKRAPTSAPAITMMLLCAWVSITTMSAFFPDLSSEVLWKVLKIDLMTIVAMSIIVTEKQIKTMMWVMTLCIAVISAKGGIFTLLSGGSYRVWGPPDSFIEDNNAFAVAAVMVVPMLAFLVTQTARKWLKWLLIAAIPLSLFSALGSQSRGALLAMCAMLLFFVIKGKNKALTITLILIALPIVIHFLPDSWFNRMDTLKTYDEDASAMGRINAWHMAWNLALDRITGGGFAVANPFVFSLYAPDPDIPLTAHSIYFQMMGEHGFIGLFLYLLLMGQTWFFAGWVIRNARNEPDGAWMIFLARMLQVSQIGFLVGGTFLSLSYWDMPFYQTVVIVAMRRLLKERQATAARSKANGEKIGAQLGEPIGEPRSEPMTVPVLEPKA